MPTKQKKASNTTRVPKKVQATKSNSKAWVGILVVLIIAAVGVVVVRFSQASAWCDQIPSGQKKLVCLAAGDAIESTTPEVDIVGSVINDSYASYGQALLSGSVGNAIWSAPNTNQPGNYTGVKGSTVNACFRMQGYNGPADVILVMKNGGNTIAQTAKTVGSAEYSEYCVDQVMSNDLQNTRFEVYLVSGKVKVDAMKVYKSTSTTVTPPPTPNPQPAPVSKSINTTARQQPNGIIVSQDGVNGAPCITSSGFKGDNVKRCEVTNTQPLQINDASNYFGTANGNGVFKICLAALGGGGKPVPIHLSSGQNATSSKTVNAVFGTEGLAGLVACTTVDLKDYPVKLFKIQPSPGVSFGMTSFSVTKQ